MQKPDLYFVSTIQDIKDNIVTLNEEAEDNLEFRGYMKSNYFKSGKHNWVYDTDTSQFGIGKFVGYKEMNYRKLRKILDYRNYTGRAFKCNGVVFNGARARERITKVIFKELGVHKEFVYNPDLINKLNNWAANQLDIDLSYKRTDEWKFLEL